MWVLALRFFAFAFILRYVSTSSDYFFKKAHSFVKPYSANWVPFGSTFITSDYARLTDASRSLRGGLYNTEPFLSRDWEIHITFRVHGPASRLYGDGFAFWYTQDMLSFGSAFGSREKFRGLGVFFDTYDNHNGEHNHEHPYISAMVNDGSKVYDHDRDGTHTQLAGCSCAFRDKPNDVTAAIRYADNTLTVSTVIDGSDNWVHCFTAKGVKLPIGYYLSVSAATGDLSDNHDIISIKTYQLDVAHPDDLPDLDLSRIEPLAVEEAAPREHIPDLPTPSKTWSFLWRLIVGLFIAVCIVILITVVYVWYQGRERRRKRFY